jgi:hypothetical protein
MNADSEVWDLTVDDADHEPMRPLSAAPAAPATAAAAAAVPVGAGAGAGENPAKLKASLETTKRRLVELDAQISALQAERARVAAREEQLRAALRMAEPLSCSDEWRRAFPWDAQLVATMDAQWGIKKFRPLQREIMNATLSKRDCFGARGAAVAPLSARHRRNAGARMHSDPAHGRREKPVLPAAGVAGGRPHAGDHPAGLAHVRPGCQPQGAGD